jgi:hypothetical protein
VHRRRVALLAVLAALCAATWTSTAIAASARGCGPSGYGYAGVASGAAVRGVGATVSALVRPRVQSGHVAAWVGVGGYGMGPAGRDEWLQLGIATSRQFTQRVYVEWARPGKRPRLVVVESGLTVGETRRLAVLELAGRSSWWRAFVDGRPVGPAVHLPGSHGRFPAVATAESWDGGRPACNLFAFRFSALQLTPAGLATAEAQRTVELVDPGYRVERRERATFVARSNR